MPVLYDGNKLLNQHSIFSATFHPEQIDPELLYLQVFSPPLVLYNWDKPLNCHSIFLTILNLKKVVLNLLYLQAFGLTHVFCNWDKLLNQHSIFSVESNFDFNRDLCTWSNHAFIPHAVFMELFRGSATVGARKE
ncbi:hypothetical protein C8J57DRAFT_1211828 [Mycena rebaudengoi]|nr:hypothetical protein C8J57DRAFT_1211828 [Mycena rebaudengoi]